MLNKNQKISLSLKDYYERKQSMNDVRAMVGFLIFFLLLNQIYLTFKPTSITKDYERNNFLPVNHDKANLTIIDKILIEARKAQVNGEVMVKIAIKESRLNPDATFLNKKGTIDRGLFQINNYWHKEVTNECAYDTDCNIKSAMQIAKRSGYNQWTTYKLIK